MEDQCRCPFSTGGTAGDMMLWDAGIQLYANPYYTTDKVLDENGDKITAAIRAISRGWGAVHADPAAGVDALVERYPNLNRESEMKAVDLVLGFTFNDKTGANGWVKWMLRIGRRRSTPMTVSVSSPMGRQS